VRERAGVLEDVATSTGATGRSGSDLALKSSSVASELLSVGSGTADL